MKINLYNDGHGYTLKPIQGKKGTAYHLPGGYGFMISDSEIYQDGDICVIQCRNDKPVVVGKTIDFYLSCPE